MSTISGNGNIRFGDGTVQSTKTPTVVSAFSNDSGYQTDADISPNYALINQALYDWAWSGYAVTLNTYNVDGGLIQTQSFNCNCNC